MDQLKEINTLVTKLIFLAQKAVDYRDNKGKRNMPEISINYDLTPTGNKITFRIYSRSHELLNCNFYKKLFIPECYESLYRQGISDSWWTIAIFYNNAAIPPDLLDTYQLYRKNRIFDKKYISALAFGSLINVTSIDVWLPTILKDYIDKDEPIPERVYTDAIYSWGWPHYQIWPGYPEAKYNKFIKIILEKYTETLEEEINARLSSST